MGNENNRFSKFKKSINIPCLISVYGMPMELAPMMVLAIILLIICYIQQRLQNLVLENIAIFLLLAFILCLFYELYSVIKDHRVRSCQYVYTLVFKRKYNGIVYYTIAMKSKKKIAKTYEEYQKQGNQIGCPHDEFLKEMKCVFEAIRDSGEKAVIHTVTHKVVYERLKDIFSDKNSTITVTKRYYVSDISKIENSIQHERCKTCVIDDEQKLPNGKKQCQYQRKIESRDVFFHGVTITLNKRG